MRQALYAVLEALCRLLFTYDCAGWLATRLFPYDRPPGVLAHPAVIAGSAAGGSPPVDSRGRST